MAPSLSLDEAREHFFVAQKACERYAAELKKFVAVLEGSKPDDAWLDQVQLEASKAVQFHSHQHSTWSNIQEDIETYIKAVRELGEEMAMAGGACSGCAPGAPALCW
jgi:hypothetical protein